MQAQCLSNSKAMIEMEDISEEREGKEREKWSFLFDSCRTNTIFCTTNQHTMTPDRIYKSVALLCATLLCRIAAGDSTGEFVEESCALGRGDVTADRSFTYLLSADVSQLVARNLALP